MLAVWKWQQRSAHLQWSIPTTTRYKKQRPSKKMLWFSLVAMNFRWKLVILSHTLYTLGQTLRYILTWPHWRVCCLLFEFLEMIVLFLCHHYSTLCWTLMIFDLISDCRNIIEAADFISFRCCTMFNDQSMNIDVYTNFHASIFLAEYKFLLWHILKNFVRLLSNFLMKLSRAIRKLQRKCVRPQTTTNRVLPMK